MKSTNKEDCGPFRPLKVPGGTTVQTRYQLMSVRERRRINDAMLAFAMDDRLGPASHELTEPDLWDLTVCIEEDIVLVTSTSGDFFLFRFTFAGKIYQAEFHVPDGPGTTIHVGLSEREWKFLDSILHIGSAYDCALNADRPR
jgi:hypothetical protein